MANVPIMLGGGGAADLDQITAGAGQILAPYVGVNGNGDAITGTIQSLGATTYKPSTSAQEIVAGKYLSGKQTIAAVSQSGIAAGNIKKGVTVWVKGGDNTLYSVVGTFEGYIAGSADFYNRGTINTGTFNMLDGYGALGTAAIVSPGQWSNVGSGNWAFKITAGAKNAIGYTKLVVEGTGFQEGTRPGFDLTYAGSASAAPNGTSAVASVDYSATKLTVHLTAAAINAGNVYWCILPHYCSSTATITRIYFA